MEHYCGSLMALTNPQKQRMLRPQLNPPTRSNAPHGNRQNVICNDPLLSMVLAAVVLSLDSIAWKGGCEG